jgi:DNA-binding SARP family transcriptional activator
MPIGTPRVRTVLALLLARPGVLVGIDQMVDELWPQHPPKQARALVHGYVSRLRRALCDGAAGRLLTRKPGYLLVVDDGELDSYRFEQLIMQARAARKVGELDRSVELFGEAHGQWRGEPFADVPSTAAVSASAAWLSELRLATIEERIDTALDAGRDAGLIVELTGNQSPRCREVKAVGRVVGRTITFR